MNLRLWYARDHINNLAANILHINGFLNPFDKLTKLSDSTNIFLFLQNMMGLILIDAPNHLRKEFYVNILIPDTTDDPEEFKFNMLNTSASKITT